MENVILTHRWGLGNRSCDLWRTVCFVASAITDLFSHPPSHRFKFSASCYLAILRMYMYKFFVEFAVGRFSNDCRKPNPKQLLRPITTRTNSSMNQSQFPAINCNSPEAREKSRVHGAIGFGFASHWLKNWHESFKPITQRSNCNHVITFNSHLKTALKVRLWQSAWRGSQRFVRNVSFVVSR